MVDVGLLLLRLAVGGLLLGHGLQKLIGWAGGPGIDGDTGFLRQLGYPRPRAAAWGHALTETLAGAALIVGLVTPAAAAAIVAVLLNAIVVVHGPNGLWNNDMGYEYPLTLMVGAATLALTGPGGWSLDATVGWMDPEVWGAPALLAGLLLGTAGLVARQLHTAERSERVPGHHSGDAA